SSPPLLAPLGMKKGPGRDRRSRRAPETSSSQSGASLSALEERAREVDPLEFPLVAELFVHPQHGGVREVVLRAEPPPARGARGRRLMALERERHTAPARGTGYAGHPVLGRLGVVAAEDRVSDGATVEQRRERQISEHERRGEEPLAPLLEAPAVGGLAARDVGV